MARKQSQSRCFFAADETLQVRIVSILNRCDRMGVKHEVSRSFCFPILLILAWACLMMGTVCSQTVPSRHGTQSSPAGTLKIFVPVGAVGDDFWIYVNGHLASSPPHGTPSLRDRFIVVAHHQNGTTGPVNGWEIWGAKGRYFGMSHETFSGLDGFLDSGMTEQFFQPIEIPVERLSYTLDLVMSSPGGPNRNSFPFVVTRKYEGTVRRGLTQNIYIALPDDWSGTRVIEARSANEVCPQSSSGGQTGAAYVDWLQSLYTGYDNDPMVEVLRRGLATRSAGPKRVIILNMPPSQGGPREFDSREIHAIVAAVESNHSFPTHGEVQMCMERFPQFTRSYTEYDRLITSINHEIESFRSLAGN